MNTYANRKYIYVFPSTNGTYNVVNYDACNGYLNKFLSLFDVWDISGHGGAFKLSADGNHSEVWFEVSREFVEMLDNPALLGAIKRLGVEIVYEYPFGEK